MEDTTGDDNLAPLADMSIETGGIAHFGIS